MVSRRQPGRWSELQERLEGWTGPALVVAVLAALFIGAKIGVVRPYEALLLGFAAPVAPLILVAFMAVQSRRSLVVPALLIAIATTTAAEFIVVPVLLPSSPVVEAELSPHAERLVALPDQGEPFDLEVHGAIASDAGRARGTYEIEIERAGTIRRLKGVVERSVRHVRRSRKSGPVSSVAMHQIRTFRSSLPGTGLAAIRLTSVDGDIAPDVHLKVRLAPLGETWIPRALLALLAMALAVEGLARRKANGAPLFAAVAFVAVFAYELSHELDRDDPLRTVIGVVMLAAVAGLGAMGVGWLAGRLASPKVKAREVADE